MRRVYIGKFSHHVRERDIERFFRTEGKIREILMKEGFAFVEFEHTTDAEAAVKHLDGRDLNGDRVHVEFAKGPPRNPRDGMRGGGMGMGARGLSRRDGPPRRDYRNDRGVGGGDRDRRDRDDTRSGGSRGGGGGGSGIGGGISYAEKYGPPRNTDYRVIVENLSSRVSWQDLKDLMRQAGEVTFADAHKRERNMGIVDFATLKDMRHAIETLNDSEFHGRRIKVYEDKSRRRGGRDFGGRSRSRSPRRYSSSRSRSRDRLASRSRSRERQASRSRSRDRQASRSRSRERQASRSRSRDRQASRSRSRDRQASRSRSRDRPVSRSPDRDRSGSRSRSRSRSQSRDRPASNSRSPIARERDAPSRSRSVSNSPVAKRRPQRSRSRSRSADSPQSDRRRSRSRSPSCSRSATPVESPVQTSLDNATIEPTAEPTVTK
jgi:arginine/serine-rich splicing factor 4/5/6